MKITVIGSGYVGLVTGACLAELGNQVCCFDVNQEKIDLLNAGEVPIYEPGLKELISGARDSDRLYFTSNPADAIVFGDIAKISNNATISVLIFEKYGSWIAARPLIVCLLKLIEYTIYFFLISSIILKASIIGILSLSSFDLAIL